MKVWLYSIDCGKSKYTVTTNKIIAEALGLSEGTVKNARAALTNDIEAIISKKRVDYNPERYQPFHCIGSEITVTAWITDNRPMP